MKAKNERAGCLISVIVIIIVSAFGWIAGGCIAGFIVQIIEKL